MTIPRHVPRRLTVLTTVVAVVAALFLGAGPASAANGNGTSVGTYTINSTTTGQGICSVVYDYSYASDPGYTGTYTSGGATYTGGLTVSWTANKIYTYNGTPVVGFENPAGQFQDPACTIPALPWTFSGATVSGSNATSSVSCTYSGTHRRDVAATETTFNGTCTVTTGVVSSTTATREVHVGEVLNCDETDGDPPPEACHENDVWVAAV